MAQPEHPRRPRIENYLDEAVSHVFAIALNQTCVQIDEFPTESGDTGTFISATILISGTLQGRCVVHLSTTAAYRLAANLIGADADSNQHTTDDAVIDDAVRELCNMIAGGWKSRLGALASACQISVPELSHNATHMQSHGPTAIRRLYAFAGSLFEVTLTLCPEPTTD
jgi:chemotaxis protein CheX